MRFFTRSASITILCLLSDPEDRTTMDAIAKRNEWRVLFASDRVTAEQLLSKVPIILIDRDLAGAEWRSWLSGLARQSGGACIILVSSRIEDSLWNDVVHNGGYETLAKPLKEAEVLRAVAMARNWTATLKK